MITKPDCELIIGARKDPDFGPVILFGMGGIMAEVIQDRSLALPPLNRLLAKRLMQDTKVYRLLKGYRNYPPANLILLEEILIRSPSGTLVPLRELAYINEIIGLRQITRENSQRFISIQCNVSGRDIGSFVQEAKKVIRKR